MKKITQLFIVLFISFLSIEVMGAEITHISIEPKDVEVGKKFDVLIHFKNEAREFRSCGVDLKMEEGKVFNLSINKDLKTPLRFAYQYENPGTYQIMLKPRARFEIGSWNTIPYCDGNTQTLSIDAFKVIKNESVLTEKADIDTTVIHNDAKANANARELVLRAMSKETSNEEKVKLYFEALKIQANYVPALLGLAFVRENQGKFDSAAKNLHLARTFLKEGPLADAVDLELIALNKSNQKKANNPSVSGYADMMNKARMYLATNQIAEAMNLLNEAKAKDSKRWEAYILAGYIAYAADLKGEAQILMKAGLTRIKDTDLKQKISAINDEFSKP